MSESAEQHAILRRMNESHLGKDVSRLMKIWNFIHLILSYPMRIGFEHLLQQWINDVYNSLEMELLSFDSLRRSVQHLLSASPLRYVQVLIPRGITEEIISGGSVSTETPLKHVPHPILLLATDLAVHQLNHSLTSDDKIQNIWFSARNDAEKRTVVEKIQAHSQIRATFLHSSTAIQRIAVQIVEKCGGHLLAIVLTAKSLKGAKDVQIWELALKNLCYHDREPIVNAFFNIIWANVTSEREKVRLVRCLMVFESQDLMISDDHLFTCWFSQQLIGSKKEAKSILKNFMECFVLLQFEDTLGRYILLPEDIKIILQAFGGNIPKSLSEGVLASAISNLQVPNLSNIHIQNLYAPNTLPPQLKELNLEGCMFETLPEAEPQKVEALSLENYSQLLELPPEINKPENVKKLMLAGCKRLETLPQIWELQDLEVCDLSDTLITHLPRFTNLPKLRILLLRNNLNLMTIPSSFFNHVPLLSILDLSCTSIHELPSSLFNLQELREFYLNHCELFLELPAEIKRLKNLTTLDLDGTLITHLPKEIEELTNLESISLSFYNDDSSFAVVPLGVLSKLTHMKVLKIGINSDNEWWFNNVEHILAEINGLKLLQALDIYIPRVNFLNPIKRHLSNFRLVIGYHKPRMISRVPLSIEVMFKESCPRLKFVNGQDFSDEVKFILSKSWAFFLDRHMKINNLTQFGLKNLKKLRLCILAECNEMQSIVDEDEYGAGLDHNASFCLQFLTIFCMKNLRRIIYRPVLANFIFHKLKLLTLHTCPELTTLFTMDSLRSLANLEELIVEDCPKVSSIISCPSFQEQTMNIFLPRLRKLSLLFVPELTSISNGVCIGRNLEQMGFYYCPKLQSLSIAELSSKKLKVIRGEIEWWKALKWSEAEWGQDSLHKFKNIFSPVDEDLDILTQLTAYLLTSFNKENDLGEDEFSSEESDSGTHAEVP